LELLGYLLLPLLYLLSLLLELAGVDVERNQFESVLDDRKRK